MTLLPSLTEISTIYSTDKNTCHSYVSALYEGLFRDLRFTARNVMELGVYCGGSVCMWRDYFANALVFGVDRHDCRQLRFQDRVVHVVADAYTPGTVEMLPSGVDIIIDDGPHTLESILFVAKNYPCKVVCGGMVVIEDVQDLLWCDLVSEVVPEGWSMDVHDLRSVKDRYDDIAIVLRSKT